MGASRSSESGRRVPALQTSLGRGDSGTGGLSLQEQEDVNDLLLSGSLSKILEVNALPEAVEEDNGLLGVSSAPPELRRLQPVYYQLLNPDNPHQVRSDLHSANPFSPRGIRADDVDGDGQLLVQPYHPL